MTSSMWEKSLLAERRRVRHRHPKPETGGGVVRIWRVERRGWSGETEEMAVSDNKRTPTTIELGILDLLTLRGFDPNCRAKLVRHEDTRFDIRDPPFSAPCPTDLKLSH